MPPFLSLGAVVLPCYVAVVLSLVLASVLRKASVIGEDLRRGALGYLRFMPYVALLILAGATPLVPGPVLWVAGALAFVAGAFYGGALVALVRAGRGLATFGAYGLSRNPIYLAATIFFIAVAIAAFAATTAAGLLSLVVTYTLLITNHVVIRREEEFLEGKFGDLYRDYVRRVPRYLLFF